MGITVKHGQGPVKPSEELEEVEWKQLDRKNRISFNDMMMLYNVFRSLPESHSKVPIQTRSTYIEAYEKARNRRMNFTVFSLGGLCGITTFFWMGRKMNFVQGLGFLLGGTLLVNGINVAFFENFYNKESKETMNQIALQHIDILDDPKYLQLNQDFLKINPNLQQFMNDTKMELEFTTQSGDGKIAELKMNEVKEARYAQFEKMRGVFEEKQQQQ